MREDLYQAFLAVKVNDPSSNQDPETIRYLHKVIEDFEGHGMKFDKGKRDKINKLKKEIAALSD